MEQETATIQVNAMTDKGRLRKKNEDAFAVCLDLSKAVWNVTDGTVEISGKGALAAVADGLGGANAGEVASKIAVESIKNFFSTVSFQEALTDESHKDFMNNAIGLAHKSILGYGEKDSSCLGMATTIVMAWVFKGKIVIGWVGDSRCYLINKGEIKILTKDHSPVWRLVESGVLTPDQADVHPESNLVSQCLGDIYEIPSPDFVICRPEPDDVYILCSDGLNAMLRMREIQEIVAQSKTATEINQNLIDRANAKGGHDNITTIVVKYLSTE